MRRRLPQLLPEPSSTPAQDRILQLLIEAPDGLTSVDIEIRTGRSQAAVYTVLGRLMARGLVAREKSARSRLGTTGGRRPWVYYYGERDDE